MKSTRFQSLYSALQLRWKIIFPFCAKSRAHAHTLTYKVCVWARDFARNGKIIFQRNCNSLYSTIYAHTQYILVPARVRSWTPPRFKMAGKPIVTPKGFLKLDFDRGDVSFSLKTYVPPQNTARKGLSPSDIKKEVLSSRDVQSAIDEVRNRGVSH